ncbi:MAG: hypothetical protein JWO36_4530 [Myxococcales bacterium]|nr:hypothetical protein [Myxococcales bacterium]
MVVVKFARVAVGAAYFALLAASACAAIPSYTSRQTAADPFALFSQPAARGTEDTAQPEKMTLARAFQLAFERNERVSIVQLGVRDAAIRSKDRWTEVEPTLNLIAGGILQRERLAGSVVLTPAEQVTAGATLVQPLYRRDLSASRAAGESKYESANASLKRQREQLARDVAEVFIDVLRTRKLLDVARAAVGRANTQHDFAAGRVKAGNALRTAELLALVDLRRTERQAVSAQREASSADIAFRRLVGRAPPSELELPPTPSLPDPKQSLEMAKRRMDLIALQLDVRGAQSEEAAAKERRWWPQLDLDASVLYGHPALLNRSVNWSVAGVLTIPLFQAGHEITDIALRGNDTHIATLELQEQIKIVIEEVELAALQVSSAGEAAALAEKEVDAAREHYQLVDKQVRLGAITFLEVTNAEAVLAEAENALEVAKMDRVRAIYDYLFAIGAIDLENPSSGSSAQRPKDI